MNQQEEIHEIDIRLVKIEQKMANVENNLEKVTILTDKVDKIISSWKFGATALIFGVMVVVGIIEFGVTVKTLILSR